MPSHTFGGNVGREILNFKGVDKGKTGFILSSGPSLKLLEGHRAELLRSGAPVIACNEAALEFPQAKYACTVDSTIYKYMYNIQFQGKGTLIPHIFTICRPSDEDSPATVWLDIESGYADEKYPNGRFSTDANEKIYNIDSPVYLALQLAFYFGWEKVYILGADYCFDPENGDTHYWGWKRNYVSELKMDEQLANSASTFISKLPQLLGLGYRIYSCSPYSKLNIALRYVPIRDAVETEPFYE